MTEQAISVSLLTGEIKRLLESGIGDVLVVGEISNYKPHSSGHRYFTLKDAEASIAGVMWRTRSLNFTPQDGMRVIVRGRLSVYPIQGKYQIDCVSMRPEGVGDLHRAFEELKQRLGALGYFDVARKRPLPKVIRSVGIATSATGAVIRDMITTIERRFPALEVVFRPAIVQGGEQASRDIARAIEELNRADVDVIIVGRGGGSLEDLWCFNTQIVADAIRSSAIPVISAVGHETDVTISDFVADVRAATPTAAAELVTPVTRQDLLMGIELVRRRMVGDLQRNIADLQMLAVGFIDGRAARRVTERIMMRSQRVDDLLTRMTRSASARITRERTRTDHVAALLASLHPLAPLQRGYAVIERDGQVINASESIAAGDRIAIRRQADVISAVVETVRPTESSEGNRNASEKD
ncbi:MAG: exodeoxyribonuclease VII large subunit [Candidatus Kapabacteria bacterium]|nr:exodeoxyribonuclease VII large subunit [Candidatus Kapabacteria bacterium]